MKKIVLFALTLFLAACGSGKIDRHALVTRNNPHITGFEPYSSLTVGNGAFAMTVDATGLQTFPELYQQGVCLGTMSEWGWHSFPDVMHYTPDQYLKNYNFRGREEPYAYFDFRLAPEFDAADPTGGQGAGRWFRTNPHRLHLGLVGLHMVADNGAKVTPEQVTDIDQTLDMWRGEITSSYQVCGVPTEVTTLCSPDNDRIAARVRSQRVSEGAMSVDLSLPYPTGLHSDDACDWDSPEKHTSRVVKQDKGQALIEHTLDTTAYYIRICWQGDCELTQPELHKFRLSALSGDVIAFTCEFAPEPPAATASPAGFNADQKACAKSWETFWKSGGAVDFSACKDPRAKELERRVVLSQYITAAMNSGSMPPQETALCYNSWFGKFHLEMTWWHGIHYALWNRPERLAGIMPWYGSAMPAAREIARRQGFEGVRWMKMTDPWAGESPSYISSFLIWQQPHPLYFAELLYRADPTPETLEKYKDIVFETAAFMADFADYDPQADRYILKGVIPAQESLTPEETVNPPYELAYWHYALDLAQQWRERMGLPREKKWDEVLSKLSPLAQKDGLYLAAESVPQTYQDERFTSDHMSVLSAFGVLPQTPLVDTAVMRNTLGWVMQNWNWPSTWGWDYPMTAMCAIRLNQPETALEALLKEESANQYKPNGHNYNSPAMRISISGNGGTLATVAMMCAGWTGAPAIPNPGFPQDGNWDVKWENLRPML